MRQQQTKPSGSIDIFREDAQTFAGHLPCVGLVLPGNTAGNPPDIQRAAENVRQDGACHERVYRQLTGFLTDHQSPAKISNTREFADLLHTYTNQVRSQQKILGRPPMPPQFQLEVSQHPRGIELCNMIQCGDIQPEDFEKCPGVIQIQSSDLY